MNNTKDIIEFIGDEFKAAHIDESNFEEFVNEYRAHEEEILTKVPDKVKFNFPLKKHVIKLIYKHVYGRIPFDKEYILKNYEKTHRGISYLYFPAKNAKKLVILFSGLTDHKTYNRYSWYWDETEKWEGDTAYLFFNDMSSSWYVGNEENPLKESYLTVIKHYIKENNLDKKMVFTVGGSMGGYASLLFALGLNIGGAISVNPQLNYKSTFRQKAGDWSKKIFNCGREFIDMDDFIYKVNEIPPLYIEYGDYEADKDGVEKLIKELQKLSFKIIVNKNSSKEHVTSSPSKEKIEETIKYFIFLNSEETK